MSVIQQRLNCFLRIHRACRKQCIFSVVKGIGYLLWRRERKYSLRNTHVMQNKCLSFLLTMTYILLKGIVHTKMKIVSLFPYPHDDPNHFGLSHMEDKKSNLVESNLALFRKDH